MAYSLGDLGRLFRNEMYSILAGGDASVPPPKNAFISWCMPGLPFQETDFAFAAQGLGTGKDAEEEKKLVKQAFNFAQLIDFIPDPTAAYSSDRQEGVWRNDAGARLSEIYGQILRFSKVVNDDLTDENKANLERWRGLLRVTRTLKDPVTGKQTEVTEDSPMLKAYGEYMQKYIAAALEYNNKRVLAQAAVGPEGKGPVADWITNAQLYKLKVNSAMDDWTAGGYRNDVERVTAAIRQVTEKSMLLWKQSLERYYEEALLSALEPGARFYYTTVAPGDFTSASGWTNYAMYHQMMDKASQFETTSWSVGGGVSFGLFNAKVGAGGGSTSYSESFQVNDFALSFSFTQVQIVRPWFYPEFLENRGWTLRKGEGWNFDDMPSDGGSPPKGRFIGYPLQALFIKNLTIRSAEFAQALSTYSSELGVEASVGYGPFVLSGNYSHSESKMHFHVESDGATITVPGMQIIGFVNHLLGKTPNLLEGIDPNTLV
jgi:hypothetical protein